MGIEDLLGLGKGAEKLLDLVGKTVGTLYKPTAIRREGQAEAFKYKLIQEAKIELKTKEIKELAVAKAESKQLTKNIESLDDRIIAKKQANERRRQKNIEAVVEKAINNPIDNDSEEEIDPDWIVKFFELAEEANSEKMQELWGKILAGEISKPGSYSIKALNAIRTMTQKEAIMFQKACSIASSPDTADFKQIILGFYIKSHLRVLLEIHEKEININDYGLNYTEILALQDIGLIHSEKLIWSPFERKHEEIICDCNGMNFSIKSKTKNFQLQIYKFTALGNELSKLIEIEPHGKYVSDMKSLFCK